MKRAAGLMWKWSLICVVTGAALPVRVWAWPSTGEPDTQLWTELDVTGPLYDKLTITGVGQLRLSDTLSNPTLTAAGVDVNYKEGPWAFTLGYRHQVTGHETYDPTVTQVVRLSATHAWTIDRSKILVRFRVEDTITASSNPWRLRLRGEYRWAPEGWGVVDYLYANDEVFYKLENNEFFRNRFQAGTNLKLTKRTDLKVYYQRQDDLVSHPGAINALGLQADVTFE
jgi:hypothetical protein